jgi:hypothetical protein
VARRVAEAGLDPREIDAAIARVQEVNAKAVKVLRWYQKPPKLRHPVDVAGLAFSLDVEEREVYRLKEVAILGVWLELPADQRAKADQLEDDGAGA